MSFGEVSNLELGERKLKVLKAIVETYVKTGEPVGSKALCDAMDISVSPATIRNEMASLVNLGLLEQPHTSSGRIPSHLGYRVYINDIMNPKPMPKEEQLFIKGILANSADDPENLLKEASQVLANITKFTAISTTPSGDAATVRKLQFVQVSRRSAMVVLMTSTGMIKNKIFRCDYDLTTDILRIFSNALNEKLCGLPLAQITPAFMQTLAASLGEISMLMPSILIAILEACSESLEAGIRMNGQTNLLFLPEIGIDNMRDIMEFLNRRNDIARLFSENKGDKVNVLIGHENSYPELANSTVIIAKYAISSTESGAIGIIGPTRMDYSKIITSLKYLASTVEQLLGKMLGDE